MFSFFDQIIWINFLLFIWFDTDAPLSYAKLFNVKRFKIKEFENFKESNPKADYFSYLRIHHKNFFTNLFTCKPCFLFWICVLFTFSNFINLALLYLLSYVLYKILSRYVYK